MRHISKIRKIKPDSPEPGVIRAAGKIIRKGGTVLFPARCLYGLAVDALNPEAVDRVFEIKQRPSDNPLLVLVESSSDLTNLVKTIPLHGKRIIEMFWPGSVTIVFEALEILPVNLTAGTGKIGVRQPGHPTAAALVKECKGPLTGTSANFSGQPGYFDIKDLDARIAEKLDLIIDAGPLKGGTGSTVVDVTTDDPVILREGMVSADEIYRNCLKSTS